MGFLGVNTRKGSSLKQRGPKRFKADPALQTSSQNSPRAETPSSVGSSRSTTPVLAEPVWTDDGFDVCLTPIERLPREILEYIFVLSANFSLAQTSFALAQKLSRTYMLELALVREQIRNFEGNLPTFVAKWPFVTAKLLAGLDFDGFVGVKSNNGDADPFVPLVVETKAARDPESLALAAFMIQRGCKVEDSIRMYNLLADDDRWKAVEMMAANQQRAEGQIVVRALRAGQGAELAIQLLRLSRNVHNDWTQIWSLQQAALEAHVPEVSTYLNSG